MNRPAQPRLTESDALILAVCESTRSIGLELRRRFEGDWPLMVVGQVGEALRHVHGSQPHVLFVCIGPEQIQVATAVITELSRRRRSRDQPLLALAAAHEEQIERAVRMAGATYYFVLGNNADDGLLRHVLKEFGITPTGGAHLGLSPPRSRTSPAAPRPSRSRRSSFR